MHLFAIILNLMVSLASGVGGVVALVNPSAMSNSVHLDAGQAFYARMYAARALPLSLAAGFLPLAQGGLGVTSLLMVAAVVQFADFGIAVSRGKATMTVGALIATAVHLGCANIVRGG